jgi:hypothetical protein
MYFAYKARTIKSVQVKFRDVKQLGSMHLYTKLQHSTFRHLEEIGVESCQNVSALPADKPHTQKTKQCICQKVNVHENESVAAIL